MTHFFKVALCALLLIGGAVHAAEVTCYNDDSQDIINQDELRLPTWGGPAPIPDPADCWSGPGVTIADDAFGRAVVVNGTQVYNSSIDPVAEARVSPAGVVAIRTERGSLLVYKTGARRGEGQLSTWFEGGADAVREFRMNRQGGLIAIATDGALVVDGRSQGTVDTATRLFASASGRLVALTSNGRVVDTKGEVYSQTVDAADAVKVAADGTVVWRTRDGKLGSTRNAMLVDGVDSVTAFKVTPTGRVAYLTADGHLGRDGEWLENGVTRVATFKILPSGAVTATDTEGHALYYK